MPLGMEIGLGSGDFVLDGVPAPPLQREVGFSLGDVLLDGDPVHPPLKPKGHSPPIFGPCLLLPSGWID